MRGIQVQREIVKMASLEELQQQLKELVAEKANTNNVIKELLADRANTQQQLQMLQGELGRNQAIEATAETMSRAMATALQDVRATGRPAKRSEVKMPIFRKDGSEDFIQFLARFKGWASLTSLSDEDKKMSFFMSFEGEAATIAQIFGPETNNFQKSYEDYIEIIKDLFSSKADSEAAKSQFETRFQGKEESAQTYAAFKLSHYMIAYPDSQDRSHLVREYIRGLKDGKVREQVVLHSGKKYEEVVAAARDAEAGLAYLATLNKSLRPVEPVPVSTIPRPTQEPMEIGACTTPDACHAAICAMMGRRGGRRDRYGRYVSQDGCWECGDLSHIKRNCPKLPPLNPNQGGQRGGRGGRRGRGTSRRGGAFTKNNNNQNRNNYGSMEEEKEVEKENKDKTTGGEDF